MKSEHVSQCTTCSVSNNGRIDRYEYFEYGASHRQITIDICHKPHMEFTDEIEKGQYKLFHFECY